MGTLSPGQRVAERYEVISLLGEGAMGSVYRVQHVYMHKPFALKVLHAELTSKTDIATRFEREAIAAGTIDHPHIAAATDFGRLEDGAFFLVLELALGRSLRKEIEKGPLDPKRALFIARRMLSGIAAAHAKGIVHRDLKPENVMLASKDGDDDFVKILDFGIAKLEPESPGDPSQPLTKIGTVIGTPEYMPPEQALGQAVDARADLYAVGVIFFEMLTGKCPFARDALMGEPPPLPKNVVGVLGPNIETALRKLLEKIPERRFQNANDALAALDVPLAPPPRRRSRMLVALLAIACVVIALPFFLWRRSSEAKEHEDEPIASTTTGTSAAPSASAVELADDIPAPSATTTTTSTSTSTTTSTSKPVATAKATAKATSKPPPKGDKKHGPFYVPPPKDWFK